MKKPRIILASQSKARSAILNSCNIAHLVLPSKAKEKHKATLEPRNTVMENAQIKAKKVAQNFNSGIVIGVDTLVFFEKKLIGKPKNKNEAKNMLKRFSGRRLLLFSGVCVINLNGAKEAMGYEKTELKVKKIDPEDIEKYFRLLGPYDKAGGFSIEGVGSIIFDDIKGSYFNVIGLPMGKLSELFKRIGLDILDFVG